MNNRFPNSWKFGNRSQVQGSMFSPAAGLKSGQFNQKTDSDLAESDMRVRDKDKI